MLMTYIKNLILKYLRVSEAKDSAVKNAIYEFRYKIYHDEYKMVEPNLDHQLKTLKDPEDDHENSVLCYTTSKNAINGTCRYRSHNHLSLPEAERKKYCFTDLPMNNETQVGFTERMAVEKNHRGSYIIAAIALHIATVMFKQLNAGFVFASCAPGLLKHYMRLGYRPYTKKLIQYDDRIEIPIVVMPDMNFLKRMQCLVFPIMKKYCDNSVKNDCENYKNDILDNYFTADKKVDDIDATPFLNNKKSFLYHIKTETANFLIQNSFFLELKAGDLLFHEREHHQEKFILLYGKLSASKNGIILFLVNPGDIVGEFGSDQDNYLRYISIHAEENSRIIVLPRSIEHLLLRTKAALYLDFFKAFLKNVAFREKELISKIITKKGASHGR